MKKLVEMNNLNFFSKINKSDFVKIFIKVVKSGKYILSNEVLNFEKKFSKFINVKHCISVANGTDALEIALKSSGIGENDLVATSANAGMYSTTAILSVGAKPLYLDVDLKNKSVIYSDVSKAIKMKVKAIIVTHLYGLANPVIKKIASECKKKKIILIEDCAQAHGARLNNKLVGSFGDIGCFSFYPTKNLGGLGDAGAIVTNKNSIANKAFKLRQYGWSKKYIVGVCGGRNSRMDEIQASILSKLLLGLNKLNTKRRKIANFYSKMIVNKNIIVPEPQGNNFVAHLYVVRTKKRESLIRWLKKYKIDTDIHYPKPDYKQKNVKNYIKLNLANTEILTKEILSIPCNPYLKDSELKRIVKVINLWKK